jgi:hypothetical protein
MHSEPTLEGIEDFDNQESEEKRSIVKKVVVMLLLIGAFYTAAKIYFSDVSDRVDISSKAAVYK